MQLSELGHRQQGYPSQLSTGHRPLCWGGLTWGLRAFVSWRSGREAMGLGDVKLFAAGGIWLGLGGLPWLLFMAALVGLLGYVIWRRWSRDVEMPFGPAIALSIFSVACAQL
ncbi:prepilin peptidase [Nitrospirillum sp. BR 11752]|uniref:prepilin peptidase n=1 Tax=Nitrospirillum sp. BR 11752 TaxID=3104293 RepID=UPI003FA5FD3A